MLSRQEGSTTRHLASVQHWTGLAGGDTGCLFLMFGGPVCADRISYCPLDRVLTYKNLIYLLNLQVSFSGSDEGQLSDSTEAPEQTEDMSYRETVWSVRLYMGWHHIPTFETDYSEPDKSNNPWKGKHPESLQGYLSPCPQMIGYAKDWSV